MGKKHEHGKQVYIGVLRGYWREWKMQWNLLLFSGDYIAIYANMPHWEY